MSTTQFTDDAYNKFASKLGSKTLIGNWQEEQSIRDATGEGRCIAQRHIKRSGLLQDFTKLPSTTRIGDNTFQRVFGDRKPIKEEIEGSVAVNIPEQGLRWKKDRDLCYQFAVDAMEQVEKAQDLALQERDFRCTSDDRDVEQPSPYNPAEKQKHSHSNEIMHGKPGTKEESYANSGLDTMTHLDYKSQVPVTLYTQYKASSNPSVKSIVKQSCPTGPCCYARDSKFSTPVDQYPGGRFKDDEVETLISTVKLAKDRHPNGFAPMAAPSGGLADLKKSLLSHMHEKNGLLALSKLRSELEAKMDKGCVKKEEMRKLLVEIHPDVCPARLGLYLGNLAKMKKDAIQVSTFFDSLVGNCTPNAIKQKILDAFNEGWKPKDIEVPATKDAYLLFFCDIYAVKPEAVMTLLPC